MAGPLGVEYGKIPFIDTVTLVQEPLFDLVKLRAQMAAVDQIFTYKGENPETGKILLIDSDKIIQDIFPTQFEMLCALGKVKDLPIPIVINADEAAILI